MYISVYFLIPMGILSSVSFLLKRNAKSNNETLLLKLLRKNIFVSSQFQKITSFCIIHIKYFLINFPLSSKLFKSKASSFRITETCPMFIELPTAYDLKRIRFTLSIFSYVSDPCLSPPHFPPFLFLRIKL